VTGNDDAHERKRPACWKLLGFRQGEAPLIPFQYCVE
jgi:hypothetical protein